jgi:SAM-dependent methyltransferase
MSTEGLRRHYESKYASEHGNATSETIRTSRRPLNRFEAAVAFLPRYLRGGTVLELGAGNGAVARALLNMDLGIESYTLGDISLPRVTGITATFQDDRVTACCIDAEDIPDEVAGTYDAIIMIALIEHLVDPLRAMANIRRLLKPRGIVYIDTPNMAKYTRRAQLLLGRFPSTASTNEGLTTYSGEPSDLYDEGHLHYFTYRSLSTMLIERCGYRRVDKLAYPSGRLLLGAQLEGWLARLWPEAFSEIAIVAHNER